LTIPYIYDEKHKVEYGSDRSATSGGVMYIDWITWSIWLIGLLILITWIYVPIKEFKNLYQAHKQKKEQPTP